MLNYPYQRFLLHVSSLVRLAATGHERIDHVMLVILILRSVLLCFDDLEEFAEVDRATHVIVDLAYHLEELVLGGCLAHGLQDLSQFPNVDSPAPIFIEGHECLSASVDIFLGEHHILLQNARILALGGVVRDTANKI